MRAFCGLPYIPSSYRPQEYRDKGRDSNPSLHAVGM